MNAPDLFGIALLAHIAGSTTNSESPKPELESTAQLPPSPNHKATPALTIIIPSGISPDSSPQDQKPEEHQENPGDQSYASPVSHRHNLYSPTFISLLRMRN